MKDLEAARNVPGLVRVLRLERIGRLELDATFSAGETASGSVIVWPHGRRSLLVLDDGLDDVRRIELSEAENAKAMALSADHELLAVAGPEHVTLFDTDATTPRWTLRYPAPLTGKRPWVTCHFSADTSLFWLLLPTGVSDERGDTLMVVDPTSGRVLEEREIRIALEEGPAWSIHGPHPSDPAIFLEGGMGQDGTISILAAFRNGKLHLDEGRRSITFAAYGDSGASAASLSHCGDVLTWDRYPDRTTLQSRDLSPLFTELEDGHDWSAQSLGGRRLLVPSSEGRLFAVDPADDEVVELRLNGDERNWNWSTVVRTGTSLLTARSEDHALCSWGIEAIVTRDE